MGPSKAAPVAAFVVEGPRSPHGATRPFSFPGAIPARGEPTMLSTSRLQTIVCTCDPRAAERFYSDVLGLALQRREPGALVYAVGGGELRVCPVPETRPSEHTVLGFAVADVAAVVSALTARGVAWERFPRFVHDATGLFVAPDGTRVAWMRDPDGNLLSVVQYA
jgi:catechol 2,3-dioxygenase-like lactoylglutathione lyase family enzyme